MFPSETRRTASEGAETRDETATPTREARRERLKTNPRAVPSGAARVRRARRARRGARRRKPVGATTTAALRTRAAIELWPDHTRDDAPVNAALFRLAARFLRRAFGTLGDASFVVHSETKTDGSVRAWTRFVAALALECARAVEPSRFVFPEFPEYPERGTPPVRYDMDPLSYVSIQKVASGTPARSCVARDAWSLRRDVADRRMAKTKGVVHRDVGGGVGVAFPRERRRRSGRAPVGRRRKKRKKRRAARKRPRGASRRRAGVPARDGQTEAGFVLDFTRSGARAFARSDRTRAGFETGRRVGGTNRREVRARLVSGARRLLALGIGAEELRRLAFRLRARSQSSLSSGDSSRELPLAADGGSVRGVCAGWSVETLEETLAEVNDGRSRPKGPRRLKPKSARRLRLVRRRRRRRS